MRLIDADALIEDLKGSLFYSDAIPFVEEAPTIEAVPAVRGEWIVSLDDLNDIFVKHQCSICGHITCGFVLNFCPNCGADMIGKERKKEGE